MTSADCNACESYNDEAKLIQNYFRRHKRPLQNQDWEVGRPFNINTTSATSSVDPEFGQGSENDHTWHPKQACYELNEPSDQSTVGTRPHDIIEADAYVRSDQSTDLHSEPSASIREVEPSVWVSLCLLACMFLRQNDKEAATCVLENADSRFQELLQPPDRMLLTAAGLVITILHTYNQDRISTCILDHANAVAERILPDEDPIRLTIQYLAFSADSSGKRLAEAGITSAKLESVYLELSSQYPVSHPYVIAAHFNYAWMLKYDGEIGLAEQHAWQVYQESTECFGQLHMQTITSLSVVAGCLALQPERAKECVTAYGMMIERVSQVLGPMHPYTLEAKRRLANQLSRDPHQGKIVLALHRNVLLGRAIILGKDHNFTVSQKHDYEQLLQAQKRWVDEGGNPSREQKEIDNLFEQNGAEGWVLVYGASGRAYPADI